jgi:hypothetical protein
MALENEFLIKELIKNGSDAINSRNENNQHTYYGYKDDDGLSAGSIALPEYNQEELPKAVDTVVDELIDSSESRGVFISKDAYDKLLQDIQNLKDELAEVQAEGDEAANQVEDLRLRVEELESLLDVKENIIASLQSELDSVVERLTALSNDYQSTLIKGIDESIQRVSLEARIQGLLQLIERTEASFVDTVTGAVGAKTGNTFVVRVVDDNLSDSIAFDPTIDAYIISERLQNSDIIYYYHETAGRNDRPEKQGFYRGNVLEISNITEEEININFSFGNSQIGITRWLRDIKTISVGPFSTISVPLSVDADIIDDASVGGGNRGYKNFSSLGAGDKNDKKGYILYIRQGVSGDVIQLDTTLIKRRGK